MAAGISATGRGRARAFAHAVLRAEPAVGARGVLAVAAFWGLGTGILTGLHVALRKTLAPLNTATFYGAIEAVWLAPLTRLADFLAIGLVIVLVMRAWRAAVSLRFLTVLFAFLGLGGILASARLGLTPWAIALLALGGAAALGSLAVSRTASFVRRLPRLLVLCGAWTAVAGMALHGSRAAREWWQLRTLPAATSGAPDVILLILDTVGAARMSLYGAAQATTPRLEALAEEGAVFDAAVSSSSWTLPGHAAMLTGLEPWEIAVGWNTPLDAAHPVLAQALAERGYRTGAFVANWFYAGREAGMDRGFARFEQDDLPLEWAVEESRLARFVLRLVRSRTGRTREPAKIDAGTLTDRFLRWAARRDGRPLFAMVNFMDAHAPYFAPDSVRQRFGGAISRNDPVSGTRYGNAEQEAFRAAYDAAIAYVDQQIGRLVDTLAARGQLDRTVLIVTSDHGEHLGRHDPALHLHGNSLYWPVIRVPLLVRYPPAVPAGVRVQRAVGTRRIAPTVMHLVDGRTAPFPGPSLVEEFDATRGLETPVLSFVRPGPATLRGEPLAAGPMVSAVLAPWHYIRNGDGAEELYDVSADPWETANRAADPELAPVLERLRAATAVLEPFQAAGNR